MPTTPDRKGTNNPNAKITSEYEEEIASLIEEDNELYDREIAQELSERTNITVSPSTISRLRRRMGITRKLKTLLYSSRDNPHHQAQNEEFLRTHHRTRGQVKLNQCMSTDEAGFKSTIIRKRAKARISRFRNQFFAGIGIRRVAGGSYKSNQSRAYGRIQKHASFKFNLVLTISLNRDHPVVGYYIQDEYFNSEHYTSFILNRRVVHGQLYDLIDRASFHRSDTLRENQVVTVGEAYAYDNITRDYIPTGYPQYNPVEQAFGWIKQFCEDRAPRYHNGAGWTRNRLIYVVKLAIRSITHNLVKSWYANSYKHMFPEHQLPAYLR